MSITLTKMNTVKQSEIVYGESDKKIKVFDEEVLEMDSTGKLFDVDGDLIEEPNDIEVETTRSINMNVLSVKAKYFRYPSGRVISVEGRVISESKLHKPEEIVTFDNASKSELIDFLKNEAFEFEELRSKTLRTIFRDLNLVDKFNQSMQDLVVSMKTEINELWNSIRTSNIERYIDHESSFLDLKTLMMFSKVMSKDKSHRYYHGDSFSDETWKKLDLINSDFYSELKSANYSCYYDFITCYMMEHLVYRERITLNSIRRSDALETLKKLSMMNWREEYSSQMLNVFFGNDPLDILVCFNSDKGAIFLQHGDKFFHVGRMCHYSCLAYNGYSESTDNTFINGYRTDFCGMDTSTAFETFIGMCD